MAESDPDAILKVLMDHGVDFVVIGASAGILQGAPLAATEDLDVTAARAERNLERLAQALKELDARLRLPDPEEEVELPLDAAMLRSMSVLTLSTRFGAFDILFAPDGAPPYEEIKTNAVEVAPFGLALRVARVEDLIAMKKAAGRPKDLVHLEVLLSLLEELEDRRSVDEARADGKRIPWDEVKKDRS